MAQAEQNEMDGEQRLLLLTGGPAALYRQKQADMEQLLKEKKERFEREKARWLEIMAERKRPERIVAVEVRMAAMGTQTNLKFRREGGSAPVRLTNVKLKNLGVSEWAEVYMLIKDKTAASYDHLQGMLKKFFDKVLEYETKFKEDLPLLRQIFGTPAAVTQAAGRRAPKRKTISRPLPADFPPISSDVGLNLRLPPRAFFEEGRVLEQPAGIFFLNFSNDQLFFRLDEIERASTGFLISLRKRFVKVPNARPVVSKIEEELMKPSRLNDPVLRIAKQEEAFEIEAAMASSSSFNL